MTAGYYNNNDNNVFIGFGAGRGTRDGIDIKNENSNESIYIGYDTRSLSGTSTNEIVIGSMAIGNGSNTITYGNNSITNHVFTSGNLKINTIQNVSDNNTKLILDSGILKQVTGITYGTSGSSGVSGSSGSSGMGSDGSSGSSGINGTSGTSSTPEITGETFTTSLLFDKTKYFNDYTQTRTLNFITITGSSIMNVIYSKIYVDTRYSIHFDTDFNMYRNDLSNNGIYDFWFTKKPYGVAYSIVRIDDWTPPIDEVPYSGYTIARYSPYALVLDETSGKITQITNDFNTGLTLFSNTDTKRPLFDDINNRMVFNLTGVTENLSGTTTKLFTSNNTWYITFMIEFKPETNLNGTVDKLWTLSRLNDKMLTLYNATDTHYINNTLKSITTDDILLRNLSGVHVFGMNQTSGGTDIYIDNTFITSNTITSSSGLTLSNLFSSYNATSAQPLNIRYLYDCLIYDRDMNNEERETIQSFFVTKHPDYNPSDGGTISDYTTTDLVSGSTLSSGSTINVTFTFTGSTPTEIVTIWKQGTSVVKAMTYSSDLTILSHIGNVSYCSGVITVPTLPVYSNYFSSSYILDENGRSSNRQDYSTIKFSYAT
jgi:hypothetical protein